MDQNMIDKVRAASVLARVRKSQDLGTLATWSSEDHRRFMADVLIAAGLNLPQAEVVEVLKKIDNHSATQQSLERQYGSTGHFVRKVKSGVSYEDMIAQLEASAK